MGGGRSPRQLHIPVRTGAYLPTLRLLDGVSVFFISPKSPSAEIKISVFSASTNFVHFLGHHLIFVGNPVELILKSCDENQTK